MEAHLSILTWRIHAQTSLAGYCLWSHKELDMTEHKRGHTDTQTHTHTHTHTHTKRLQTQTTHLPTPQTRCPLPRFCSLCVQSSGFCKCSITSSAYRDTFASFLPQVESFFFFFSCLIAMTRTSSGVLNTNGESGRPYLVPEF